MTIELTPEEAAAVFFLACSELAVIKADFEEDQIPVDTQEVGILLALANKTNQNLEQMPVITWELIQPMIETEATEDGPFEDP